MFIRKPHNTHTQQNARLVIVIIVIITVVVRKTDLATATVQRMCALHRGGLKVI
jgi:hypothetical protein